MAENDPVLLVEAQDRIRIVRLNRPEAFNAANDELHRRLAEVWVELESDPGCFAVVLTGNGALNKQLERAMPDVLDFALAAESISSGSVEHRQIADRFLAKRG
jgi:hypothetical protein